MGSDFVLSLGPWEERVDIVCLPLGRGLSNNTLVLDLLNQNSHGAVQVSIMLVRSPDNSSPLKLRTTGLGPGMLSKSDLWIIPVHSLAALC